MLYSGVEITIYPTGKKRKTVEPTILRFPKLDRAAISSIIFNSRNVASNYGIKPMKGMDPAVVQTTPAEADSMRRVANEKVVNEAKEIVVHGISNMTDSLESVYNEDGLKAASQFDSNNAYAIELQVPLRSIGLQGPGFGYRLALHGRQEYGSKGLVTHFVYRNGEGMNADIDLESLTDFSGAYTLAKKP